MELLAPAKVNLSLRVLRRRDDGFHEIQLNGKQLVFLFMAVTVVSVVIFLSGVLVGRGVRAERKPIRGRGRRILILQNDVVRTDVDQRDDSTVRTTLQAGDASRCVGSKP